MRSQFTGHFPLSDDVKDRIWESGAVVLDANVLLNLYRLQIATRDSMLDAMGSLQRRLWMPYQVASEFHRNRIAVIRDQQKVLSVIQEKLNSIKGTVRSQLRAYSRNPVIDISPLSTQIEDSITACEASVARAHEDALSRFGVTPQDDPILEYLGDYFENRVGRPFPSEQLAGLYEEGEDRIGKNIPPGYSDNKKPIPQRYGDFLVWKQILVQFAENPMDLILVTDDEKEDWWLTSSGETLGGRPELFQEFNEGTGRHLLMYRTPSFLMEASRRGIVSVRPESVADATELLASDERDRRKKQALDAQHKAQATVVAEQIARLVETLNVAHRERERIAVLLSEGNDDDFARDEEFRARRQMASAVDLNDRRYYLSKANEIRAQRLHSGQTLDQKVFARRDFLANQNDELESKIASLEAELASQHFVLQELREQDPGP